MKLLLGVLVVIGLLSLFWFLVGKFIIRGVVSGTQPVSSTDSARLVLLKMELERKLQMVKEKQDLDEINKQLAEVNGKLADMAIGK